MKNPSSPDTKPPVARKRLGRPAATRASESPAALAGCLRLEITPPAALMFIEPPHAREVATRRRVRFGYFKPEAREVHVVGSFNGWNRQATPMHRDALGDWSVEIDLPPGEHHYRFFVDGEWRDDPAAPQTAMNPFGGYDAIMTVV